MAAVKTVSTRELLSTTRAEEAQGARPAIPVEMAEQLVNFIHERDPMAIFYIRHLPKEEPVQVIGIDGPRILREMFRDLSERIPTIEDLLKRLRKLQDQLRRSHPTVEEIHWLFENLDVTGDVSRSVQVDEASVLVLLDQVVACDAALDMASRHDAKSVLNIHIFEKIIPKLDLRTELNEDMFVNLPCFNAICQFISMYLTSTREGQVVKVVQADQKTPTSHSFEQLVWTWLQERVNTRQVVMLVSYRDTLVNVGIQYALEAPPDHPRLLLQTHKVRFQVHRLLDVLHAWADIYREKLEKFVKEFTMIVQLAIPTYHGTIASLDWMFDMWASSRDFFKDSDDLVVGWDEKTKKDITQSEIANDRLRFAGIFNRLLQLHLAGFVPVARIPALVKPSPVSSTSEDTSFSKDLTHMMSQLTLERAPAPPKNPFAIMTRTYWLPSSIRRTPPQLTELWQRWLLTLTKIRKPLILDEDADKDKAQKAEEKKDQKEEKPKNIDNFEFILEMLRYGAPWTEIVESLVFARNLNIETVDSVDKPRQDPQIATIGRLTDNLVSTANDMIKEAKAAPWTKWSDLPSFDIGVARFGAVKKEYFAMLGRHLCVRVAAKGESRDRWQHEIPKGLPRHIATHISRSNRWFIDLDYPWARNYAACAWQLCRSPATLDGDRINMVTQSIKVDSNDPQKRGDQMIVFELSAPVFVSAIRARQ